MTLPPTGYVGAAAAATERGDAPSPLPPATLPYPTEPDQLPALFRPLAQFVAWRWERRDAGWTKVLIDPDTGQRARANDPSTWDTFAGAVACARRLRLPGISIVLTEALAIVGGDLDHCHELASGRIAPWADAIRRRMDTATWVSTTGTGLRWFVRARFPDWFVDGMTGKKTGRRDAVRGIEVYRTGRHLTLTTVRVPGTPEEIEPRQAELETWLREAFPPKPGATPPTGGPTGGRFDDAEVLRRCESGATGERFRRLFLYGDLTDYTTQGRVDHSAGDLALANYLRFYSGDRAQVERLFQRSALARRDKWQRADYRARTLDTAMVGDVYTPPHAIDLEGVATRTNGAHPAAAVPPPAPPPSPSSSSGGGAGDEEEPASLAPGVDGFALTELGNAERLLAAHGSRLRYCDRWRMWVTWDGRRWALDADECRTRTLVRRVIRKMGRDAQKATPTDKKGAVRLFRWAVRCEAPGAVAAAVTFAKTFPRQLIDYQELDAEPWLLNCRNGTINLRTGELQPHDPAQLLTKLTPVVYAPDAAAPVWERFVAEVTATADGQPDPAMVTYLQRAIGHSLTGDLSEQVLYFAHGQGANGKSTLLNAVRRALGEYAMQAGPDLLMVKDRQAHPTELTDLFRMRLVVSTELEDGRRLAEALVKQMTGGEPIRARRMREDLWEFEATHTVWIAANHKPIVRGTDHAMWRRIRLVPFDVTFYDRATDAPAGLEHRLKDPTLPAQLAAELPGILAWAVRGCTAWARDGLVIPERVREATDGYRQEMDVLAAFLEACCVCMPQASAPATALYEAYRAWCEAGGEHPETQTRFGLRLTERGFAKGRATSGQVVRLGVGLRATNPPAGAPGGAP